MFRNSGLARALDIGHHCASWNINFLKCLHSGDFGTHTCLRLSGDYFSEKFLKVLSF